jgi:signal transduction histidine kinase
VILSDFNMPKLTGLQFLKRAKGLLGDDIATILLTGYSDKDSAIQAINEVGLYRYLEKPWDNHQLLQTIETALQHARLKAQLTSTLARLAQQNEQLETLVSERTQELQEAHTELHTMITQSLDGVLRLTAQGSILHLNPTMAQWVQPYLPLCDDDTNDDTLTQTMARCIGLDIALILPALKHPLSHPNSSKSREDHSWHGSSYEFPLGELWLEGRCSELTFESGGPNEFLWVFRDITERKQLEHLRDDFMATLTHDLRTPLQAAIQTCGFFVQGILGDITDKQRTVLNTLEQSNRDMLGLVNTLLDVYRYEAGKYPLVSGPLLPHTVVEHLCQELLPLANQRQQTLQHTAHGRVAGITLQADKQELKRVMVNLLSNAIRHTPKQGAITVHTAYTTLPPAGSTHPHPPEVVWQVLWPTFSEQLQHSGLYHTGQTWWLYCVQDTGHGLSQADQAKLFHRFSQGSSHKRNSGSGLGLYLSSHIMHQHGGIIGCHSVLGEGSYFFIALPQHEAETPQNQQN